MVFSLAVARMVGLGSQHRFSISWKQVGIAWTQHLDDQLDCVLTHYDDILSHYGIDAGVRIARKHIGWYSKGLRDSAEFRAQVNQMTEPVKVRQAITDFYHANLDQVAA